MILNNQHLKDFETYLINLKLNKELTIKRYISYYKTFLGMFADILIKGLVILFEK